MLDVRGTGFYLTKLICWIILRLGFGLEVVGGEHVPKRGPFVLASNHVSFLDPVVVGVSCPRRVSFLARTDLFKYWLLGAFMRAVDVIPINRDTGDVGAIRAAVRQLRHGTAVAIFPEGGRQFSGRLGTAKAGVGLIAVLAKAPVVPVLVRGTFEAMPPSTNRLRPSKIRVAFGPPIPYTNASSSTPGDSGEDPRGARPQRIAEAVTQRWRQLDIRVNG